MPPWVIPTFYAFCGVTIVGLIARMMLKNRQASPPPSVRPFEDQLPPVTVSTQMPPASPLVPEGSSVTPRPMAPTSASFATLPPGSMAGGSISVGAPMAAATLAAPSPFSRPVSNELPRFLRDQLPGIPTDDMTFGSVLTPAFAALLPESESRKEEMRAELLTAGYYNPHALLNLSATRYVLMMLGLLVFGGLLLIVPPRLEPWMLAGVVIAPMLGWALPRLMVRRRALSRKVEIEHGMPDLLDMLNMCVSQGLTVPESLRRILRDLRYSHPALAQELQIVLDQASIASLPVALENFSRRVDLPEVHSFTSLLIQTERMGTSISDALSTYSDTMRESLRQRADEKGNRATFRLLFPTVLCLTPAVYLFLLGPAVVELSKFFYSGQDRLDQGNRVIQRINNTRRGIVNPDQPLP